ncbi:mannose/fructose/sorbose PTS transporter subunit IIA [Garciella nitratireducens]|uniref:PTS system D-mannose-specific IIA component, Man family n=1 Tax=Garciella nitratireducens DSM 15102 TaxID=1121911 RepID=A0A1T4LNZ9_9FIRM|nr:mannose/fructose/sorbose PTS transporter subunit IIA [Garciella nitratireducens]SJZ56393.1 PTS system D-mannose-specific IIA component, Man family [Garciella nitratireducens DSM 15102]
MIAIIVGTHGKLATELIRSGEMIVGNQENIAAITFESGENTDDLLAKYNEKLKNLNTTDGVLFMVDLFGGSPYNAAAMIAAKNFNMDIVTGVNIPMLLETLGARNSLKIVDLVITAKKAGQEGIKSLKETLSKYVEEDL